MFAVIVAPAFACFLNLLIASYADRRRIKYRSSARLISFISVVDAWRSGWDHTLRSLANHLGEPLLQFLKRAESEGLKVQVTLGSDKVYIGLIKRLPARIHHEASFIELLSEYSFSRSEKTGRFPAKSAWTVYPAVKLAELKAYRYTKTITALEVRKERNASNVQDVRKVLQSLLADVLGIKKSIAEISGFYDMDANNWVRLIPVAEIKSLAYFDEAAFDWFAKRQAEPEAASEPSTGV